MEYGYFVYQEERTPVMAMKKKRNQKQGFYSEVKYKKARPGSYRNRETLNRFFESNYQKKGDKFFKVIYPLEFPVGYKIYDHNGDYYGTVVENDPSSVFVAIRTRYQKEDEDPMLFIEEDLYMYYIKAERGKKGFKVREEEIN